ncbi:MAG: DUF1569 domain-containing protein [Williamsia sp.]|nr:DUF1569 domain-containing protein [Williamsia sp.]
MKTITDQATRDELIQRIRALTETSVPLWGKMTVSQMMKHCSQWDEMAQGKKKYRQSFIGKLFGKMALRNMMNDKPLKRNMPTVPSFKIKNKPDFATEKQKWIRLMDDYQNLSGDGFMHPFFGALTREDTGRMVYKHCDHHLQQFGV